MNLLAPRGDTVVYTRFVLISAVMIILVACSPSDEGGGKFFAFLCGIWLVVSVVLLARSVWKGNGLTVLANRRKLVLHLSSYASADIGPLAEIEGKTLCLDLRYRKAEHDALNGKPPQPPLRSFRLSPNPPVCLDGISLDIQLVRLSGAEEEVTASNAKFVKAQENLQQSDSSGDANELDLTVPRGSGANCLRITNPSEEEVRLTVNVYEVTDLSRIKERNPALLPPLDVRVRKAQRQSVSHR